MRTFVGTCAFLQLLTFSEAATACKKDACYNNVSNNGANRPNLASRRKDCSSILRTVVDDNVTATVTATTTVPKTTTETSTSTTVVATRTLYSQPPIAGRQSVQDLIDAANRESLLEERDKIVIKGKKPAYATACANNQDYGKSHHLTQTRITYA